MTDKIENDPVICVAMGCCEQSDPSVLGPYCSWRCRNEEEKFYYADDDYRFDRLDAIEYC